MGSVEAPSFERARLELYQQLAGWCFVRVVRPCVQGDNGYFHGTGVEHSGARVWFQKQRDDTVKEEHVGPLTVCASTDMPRPGDVLMGKSVPTKQRSDKLLFYFAHANHVEKLRMLVEQGTNQSETQLAHELRARKPVKGGIDDAWALVRLVLFGNVKAFAHQHLKRESTMRLSCDPLTFVHKCATDFDDPALWDAFVQLVPDAVPPTPPAPPTPPRAIVKPLNFAAVPEYVGKRRRQRAPSPPYNPHSPRSPGYNPYTPPRSPVYNPYTPPRSPQLYGAEAYSPTSADMTLPPPLPPLPHQPPLPSTPYSVESVMNLLQSVAAVRAQQQDNL